MATRRRCQNFFASLSAVRGRRNFRSLFVRACAGCCIAASHPKTQGRFRTIHKGSPQNVRDFCPNLVMKYSAKSMQPGLAWLFLGCPSPSHCGRLLCMVPYVVVVAAAAVIPPPRRPSSTLGIPPAFERWLFTSPRGGGLHFSHWASEKSSCFSKSAIVAPS